jgi:hypothetical protein
MWISTNLAIFFYFILKQKSKGVSGEREKKIFVEGNNNNNI